MKALKRLLRSWMIVNPRRVRIRILQNRLYKVKVLRKMKIWTIASSILKILRFLMTFCRILI